MIGNDLYGGAQLVTGHTRMIRLLRLMIGIGAFGVVEHDGALAFGTRERAVDGDADVARVVDSLKWRGLTHDGTSPSRIPQTPPDPSA